MCKSSELCAPRYPAPPLRKRLETDVKLGTLSTFMKIEMRITHIHGNQTAVTQRGNGAITTPVMA